MALLSKLVKGLFEIVFLVFGEVSVNGRVIAKVIAQSKSANKNEPTKGVSNIKVPMFAKFGPKIPPIIPPATTKAVALFLSFCVAKFRASLAKNL